MKRNLLLITEIITSTSSTFSRYSPPPLLFFSVKNYNNLKKTCSVLRSFIFRFCTQNVLNNSVKLNLIINADGARLRYSRSGEAWPISALIVELPKSLRYKFENVLLLGMWIGNHKPIWDIFLGQLTSELELLKHYGFSVTIKNNTYKINVNILATVLDMPARSSFWNVKQFNGKFGCMECKHPGYAKKNEQLLRTYPYFDFIEEKNASFYE